MKDDQHAKDSVLDMENEAYDAFNDDATETESNLEKDLSNSKSNYDYEIKYVITLMCMSTFAIIGSLLRMILAQLFGEECKNPGTVGWLAADEPLCVTADKETNVSGGIIFADLPANLLGSFIMGLMQSTDTMDYFFCPKKFPIAFLSEHHSFQNLDVIHLAIRTGFCGSLTTFSSWNSEMVILMLGTGHRKSSLVFRGLLGYFIGIETALASFMLGKNIARYMHAYVNPQLAKEGEESRSKKECGIFINNQLSDVERCFLSGIDKGEFCKLRCIDPDALKYLERWRKSTEESRRVGHELLPFLMDIEYDMLVLGHKKLSTELSNVAIQSGWNANALENWVEVKKSVTLQELQIHENKLSPPMSLTFISVTFSMIILSLILGLALVNNDDAYSITYRTMIYAALFAPFGAILRWKLSRLNKSLKGEYKWFPLGTFAANFFGSIVSISMIALDFKLQLYNDSSSSINFWMVGTLRAIKIGFAGCLSTVSTFIAEFSSLLSSIHPVHGYKYAFISFFMCALCSSICYILIINL